MDLEGRSGYGPGLWPPGDTKPVQVLGSILDVSTASQVSHPHEPSRGCLGEGHRAWAQMGPTQDLSLATRTFLLWAGVGTTHRGIQKPGK